MVKRPRILVISFSNIARDARVLRQINAVSTCGDVTTIGYGEKPTDAVEHLEVPAGKASLPVTVVGVVNLALRRHDSSELAAPGIRAARELVGDRRFDLIVANDARAIPLAFEVSQGAPVWADLHEWAPEERTHVASWRILVAPLMGHICAKYLPRCAATTTVGAQIAQLYSEHYGVTPKLVRNAAPYADLTPSPVEPDSIRLVHSGGAVPGRNIEEMIGAVLQAKDSLTLDLYLVPANDGGAYLKKLHGLAGNSDRITFHKPVEPHELPAVLNQYDVGIYWIPPYSTNAELALPNKIFDFIQARLAIAVGPTVEMARIVREFDMGVVSKDFSRSSIVSTLNALETDQVREWKHSSNLAASTLSFENESSTIITIVESLLARE